jgi:hypothetical protein
MAEEKPMILIGKNGVYLIHKENKKNVKIQRNNPKLNIVN